MTDTHASDTPAAHAAHDLTSVAALAARTHDLDDGVAAAARAQVAGCTTCADLLADLVALQTVLPTTATPARPRDFRLAPAEAARLHRTGWRRVLAFFGSARDGFSRPLAIGFTTLGLAGLLLATLPSMSIGSGGAAMLSPVGEAVQQAAPAPPAEAYGTSTDIMSMEAPAAAGGGEPADSGVFSGANPDEVSREIAGDAGLFSIRDDASGLSVLFVLAGVMLIVGLALFGLRWSARRLL